MRPRGFGRRLAGAALAALAPLAASSAGAQTRFAWPDTTVDVASYATLEECRAAVQRSQQQAATRAALATTAWLDTLPIPAGEPAGPPPLPTEVVETARRCGARFGSVDAAPLDRFAEHLVLYLQAGWDDRARALVDRRLGAVAAGDDAARAAVLDSTVTILLGSGAPDRATGAPRDSLVEAVVGAHLPHVADPLLRLDIHSRLGLRASNDPDPARGVERAARIVARMAPLLDSLSESQRDVLRDRFGGGLGEGPDDADGFAERYTGMLNYALGAHALMDSLRSSTAAYVALKNGNWTRATGARAATSRLGGVIGQTAPAIEADFWVGAGAQPGVRPTPGRVSLVVFLDPAECAGVVTLPAEVRGDCARYLVPLRWLEERYPALETTVVMQTHGYFEYVKDGLTPEREAELAKRMLEGYGVRAPLAVTVAEPLRLPAPDGRRLERPSANRTRYEFGRRSGVSMSQAFLVDEDGVVVHSRGMNRHAVAQDFDAMVRTLLERRGATP